MICGLFFALIEFGFKFKFELDACEFEPPPFDDRMEVAPEVEFLLVVLALDMLQELVQGIYIQIFSLSKYAQL